MIAEQERKRICAGTSKMTQQISAIWMFHAMSCVYDFFIQAKVIYKCLVVQTCFTYWNNIVVIFINRLTTIIILTQR